MARGIVLLTTFLIVDCLFIWWVNSIPTTVGTAALLSAGDKITITFALVGAAVIAVLAAIIFKVKPVPARFR